MKQLAILLSNDIGNQIDSMSLAIANFRQQHRQNHKNAMRTLRRVHNIQAAAFHKNHYIKRK